VIFHRLILIKAWEDITIYFDGKFAYIAI
jgi:hypothetical protein